MIVREVSICRVRVGLIFVNRFFLKEIFCYSDQIRVLILFNVWLVRLDRYQIGDLASIYHGSIEHILLFR